MGNNGFIITHYGLDQLGDALKSDRRTGNGYRIPNLAQLGNQHRPA